MQSRHILQPLSVAVAVLALAGCSLHSPGSKLDQAELEQYKTAATRVEYPDAKEPPPPALADEPSPLAIGRDTPPEYWDITLVDALRTALTNSKVLNDIGGLVLNSPTNARTIHGPALAETDPRFGTEATQAAFDPVLSSSANFAKNHRAINNVFFGGGTRIFQQDTAIFSTAITKRTAVGSTFTISKNTDFDQNNAPGNLFPEAWNTNYQAEVRQPLLQGAGAMFNRIYGPPNVTGVFSGVPGFANGVMVARINTDISITEFEMGVRDLVSNVENAYWDLYFAYRDLDAKIAARDAALETWRQVHALYTTGRRGGEAEKEAEAREQYLRLQEEVQFAWYGRLVSGTQTSNGSGGGTWRGVSGVRTAERRMRMLMNVPINDTKLLRPLDQPKQARVIFEWPELLQESLARRSELRRQRWVIKRRELELLGARNFLLPSLDATGLYRFRGFGNKLYDFNNDEGVNRYDNAVQNLFSGQFQEWQAGMEFSMPFGFRRGHAAVRNAELQLARERAVLSQQEREVVLQLSNALAEVERAYETTLTSYNRLVASRQHYAAVRAEYEADKAQADLMLESQRRLAEAEIRYHGAMVEYQLAVKNVHFEKGSLLDYNDIYLAEGPWPGQAYADASERDRLRMKEREINYGFLRPPLQVSAGPYDQFSAPKASGATPNPPSAPPTQPVAPNGEELPPMGPPANALPPRGATPRPPQELMPPGQLEKPSTDGAALPGGAPDTSFAPSGGGAAPSIATASPTQGQPTIALPPPAGASFGPAPPASAANASNGPSSVSPASYTAPPDGG